MAEVRAAIDLAVAVADLVANLEQEDREQEELRSLQAGYDPMARLAIRPQKLRVLEEKARELAVANEVLV